MCALFWPAASTLLTPPSSIPQQTKVESGEPRATSGPGGGNISVSAISYISWHPPFPTQIPWLVRRNNQLPTTTTDHTERAKRVRGGRGEWEGGDLSWKLGVPADIENGTHRNISPPRPRGPPTLLSHAEQGWGLRTPCMYRRGVNLCGRSYS